jgi:Domain of unknown function (DUF4365)
MSSEQEYPLESEAQRIGQRAQKCFAANRPDSWRVQSLEGTDDAGFDYQIQIVDSARYIGFFRVQLKGSESPEINASGESYSIPLSRRTLNYYARATECCRRREFAPDAEIRLDHQSGLGVAAAEAFSQFADWSARRRHVGRYCVGVNKPCISPCNTPNFT